MLGKLTLNLNPKYYIPSSIWFGQVTNVFATGVRYQAGRNPELRTLFWRLVHLFKLPVVVVVVFDGLERPVKKRGQKRNYESHWLVEDMKELTMAFGFHWHQV